MKDVSRSTLVDTYGDHIEVFTAMGFLYISAFEDEDWVDLEFDREEAKRLHAILTEALAE